MRAAVFLVSLCFLLLSGANRIHASVIDNNNNKAHYNLSSVSITYSGIRQFYAFAKPVNIDKERESIICDDVEDEDTESFFAKKCKQQSQGYSIHCWLSYLYTLNHLSNTYKAVRSVYGVVSPIYILHRVFRI
jgi:hypothetical protein